jgi:hypothetical protein
MTLPKDFFDTALTEEIKQAISSSKRIPASVIVAKALKDSSKLSIHIQETQDANPNANGFIFPVWYQSEWVIIEYNKSQQRYQQYSQQAKIPNYPHQSISSHCLNDLMQSISKISKELSRLEVKPCIKGMLDEIDMRVQSILSDQSYPEYYVLRDMLNDSKQYQLIEVNPGQWVNAVINDNQVIFYGKPEVLSSDKMALVHQKMKKNAQTRFSNEPQKSSLPSFHQAMNNLVQIRQGVSPSHVLDFKLIEAFTFLNTFEDDERASIDSSESSDSDFFFRKIDAFDISYDEDNQTFSFKNKPHFFVKNIALESDDSNPESVLFYQNSNKPQDVFIIGKKETITKYQQQILKDCSSLIIGKKIHWIAHETDIDQYKYLYEVLLQIDEGKDINSFVFQESDSRSDDSISSFTSCVSYQMPSNTFFKPNSPPKKTESQNSQLISRNTLINAGLFIVGAGCLTAFCLTMAGPLLFLGLLLFAVILNRICDPKAHNARSISNSGR